MRAVIEYSEIKISVLKRQESDIDRPALTDPVLMSVMQHPESLRLSS